MMFFCYPATLRILSSTSLLLLISLTAWAQTSPVKLDAGNGGQNTIQGDIFAPSGQRFDRPVEVRLTTPRGDISTTSNGNGSFVFRALTGGRYAVRIDPGEPYVPSYEIVDVAESGSTGRMGSTFTVQVHLRLRANAPTTTGVVSANAPPKEAIELYNQALISVKEGKRDQAIEQLKAAIAIHPSFVAALNGLGVQYLKIGKFQPAYEAFNTALTFAPDSFLLHLNAGMALFSLNRFSAAEAEFRAATQKNETSGAAHLYRARALIALNRLTDAVADLKKAIAIGGEDVKTAHRYLAGIHMENGENAEAVKELELYLKAAPDTKEADQIKNLIRDLNKKRTEGRN
jgi:Tfp pilus assembly protein PilF